MVLRVFESKTKLSEAAARQAAEAIRTAIRERGSARIVSATGASQFEFLDRLVAMKEIAWERVELFHLDEYIGLPMTHPASFCRYLQKRLIQPAEILRAHLMDGAGDPREVIRRTGAAINEAPIDATFAGIGENGHLAFNDPPADFATEEPYIVVELDEACRKQQVSEGWFARFEEVPKRAISMSVRQILKSREIIAIVPDARKAGAVKACFEGEINPMAPASILRTHAQATIYLDQESAELLSEVTLERYGAKVTG